MDKVRCSVNYWADFGDLLFGRVLHIGTEALLTTGTSDVLVFSCKEKEVKAILQFDSPVTSLALSDDKSLLYALCLNNGLYCTALSLESRSPSLSAQKCDNSTLTINSFDIVIKDEKIQSFILVERNLIVVGLQGSFWGFDLYEVQNCSTEATNYHKHASFQVPAVATTAPQNTVNAGMVSAPVFVCIYPSKNSSTTRHGRQHHCFLQPLLFRLLFGVDASLVHSPVILCGLPDGRVFYFPLILPALGEQKPRIRMLHSMGQPVIFIGTSVTDEQGPQCLLVIGQMGQILMIRANEARSEGKAAEYSFCEQTVQGPVVCACVDGEHLYYSTSANLMAAPLRKTSPSSSLTLPEGERLGMRSERPPLLCQSTACLGVCQVIALAEPSITPTGCVQLLALSLRGRLLQVTVPQKSENDSVSRLSSSQVGQTMKDLLAGIGNVWERASSLKLQVQLKNNILERLNKVINICNLHLTYQKRDEDRECRPPLRCHGAANWRTLLQQDSLVFTCTLENSSACALDQGWTLFIEVQLPSSLNAESPSRTFQFALKKLDCGQKTHVSLPLESQGEVFLPVKIHCFLVFSLQSLLCLQESRHHLASDSAVSQHLTDKNCISLALNTLTLDWLDCLRIGEPSLHGEIPEQSTPYEDTRLFLSSRQIHTVEKPVPKAAPHVMAIQISFELLRSHLGLDECNSAALCISVLKWLLNVTSEVEGQKLVESPVVCAHGPGRQPVRLLTKEVILKDVTSEGPLSVMEVQVESFSIAAVCGLHHAVLRRVQVLLKNTMKCVSPSQLKGQWLNEAVQHAESLYKDIQVARTSAAFGEMKTESLFHLYFKLRRKPLVIL